MISSYPHVPPRLAPFLAQWDYVTEQLFARLDGLTDEELLWDPAPRSWTVVRLDSGSTRPTSDSTWWAPDSAVEPPRTLAWSMGHLGAGSLIRADWLVGSRTMTVAPDWPVVAPAAREYMRAGLEAWRNGLEDMSDDDLDTVGRSAYPDGLDPQLPLMDIVWWVNKELLWHAAEIWYVRDLYAARNA